LVFVSGPSHIPSPQHMLVWPGWHIGNIPPMPPLAVPFTQRWM
jgi:hypothetical protein